MAVIYEEIVKAEKDRSTEAKFKNVRTGLKLALAKYIHESNNGAIEKTIESFVGLDLPDKKLGDDKPRPVTDDKKKSFLDDLLAIGKIMDETFSKLGEVEEGALAHKLTTVSAIYMEQIAMASAEAKLNNFPYHKEKFAMDISEEHEAKNIVPRVVFRSIKMFLDKYYFVFRQASVNAKARIIYVKLSEFREKLQCFEYGIGHSIGMLKGEYIKEIAPFYKDTKKALLRLRKFFEAIEDSPFGKLVKLMYDLAIEQGTRIFVKNNASVTVTANDIRKGAVIPIQSILDKYDRFMVPIRTVVADYDNAKRAMNTRSPLSKDTQKAFWDISDQIVEFREGMKIVIDEFQKGVSPSDNDFKFFMQTVQAVLIPYMNQTRGEVNESFSIGVRNLDTFFWKVMVKAIEGGQDAGERMDEIAGLAIRLKEGEMMRKDGALGKDSESSTGE